LVIVTSFTVLGSVGCKAISNEPPVPSKIVTADGQVLFTGENSRALRITPHGARELHSRFGLTA
jgi:nitric oxide reductase large subunit